MSQNCWREINYLLSIIRHFGVVDLVDEKFSKGHGNDAPGKLLTDSVARLQKLLDQALADDQQRAARTQGLQENENAFTGRAVDKT